MEISEINNEDATLISQGVKKAFGADSWELLETLTRGLSPSSLYKLMIDGNRYVAKISDPNHPHNNLEREYHAMSIAAKNNVAPAVYYADSDGGVIIMDYIENVLLSSVDRQMPNMINKFADFIKRLHSCDNFQKNDSIFRIVEIVHDLLPLDLKGAKLVNHAIKIKDEVQKYLVVNGGAKPRIDGAGQVINKITSGPISAKACINFTLTSIAPQTV